MVVSSASSACLLVAWYLVWVYHCHEEIASCSPIFPVGVPVTHQSLSVRDRRPNAVHRGGVVHVEPEDERRRHDAPQAPVSPFGIDLFCGALAVRRPAEIADLTAKEAK